MRTSLASDSKTGFFGTGIKRDFLHRSHFTKTALKSFESIFFILSNTIFVRSGESSEIEAFLRGGGTGGAWNSSCSLIQNSPLF